MTMQFVLYIARRFFQVQRSQSQKFISFITLFAIIGVTLGVTALIITLTILSGFEKELREKVFSFTSHVQITAYQNRHIPEYRSVIRRVKTIEPSIASIEPFVAKEGMISFGEEADGIFIKGVYDTLQPEIKKYLIQGSFNVQRYDSELYGCVIGKKLVSTLHARLGDTLIAFGLPSQFSADVQPTIVGVVVNGIYESGMAEYDDIYVYTSMNAAQYIFGYKDDEVSGFDLRLRNPAASNESAAHISQTLGFPFFARSIFQRYRNLFTWIELQKQPIPVVLGLITLVAAINIIGTMLMLVLEKRKQVGILQALGASRREIKYIFLFQGSVIGIVGTLAGNILGFGICWMQSEFNLFSLPSTIYFMSSVPILFSPINFLIVSTVSILLCVGASFIPAVLASRLDPIKSIRSS